MNLLVALIVALCAALPLALALKRGLAIMVGSLAGMVAAPIMYFLVPTFGTPFFGAAGVLALLAFTVGAIVDSVGDDKAKIPVAIAAIGFLAFIGRGCVGSDAVRAKDYAAMLGQVEERVWTQDVQPKDPDHVRLVPKELASFMSDKNLGEAEGALGSQFDVDKKRMTLQTIKGELWYVAPLDFEGFMAWTAAKVSPGYVMVHAEDPSRAPVLKLGQKFTYMPGAFWGDNLERHVWNSGYASHIQGDPKFEIDEEGNPHWIVPVLKPTIQWWGERVQGVVIVDPTTGATAFHELGKTPAWIDRAIPHDVAKTYIEDHGRLSGGWRNSWIGKANLTKPLEGSFIYGSDGTPYWVYDISSTNDNDESLLGLMYVNSRTGKATYYKAKGSVDEAVLKAVNNKVAYLKQHGDSPTLYNFYGTMASVVPILGESHTFQGVAIVSVEKLQIVAVGADMREALRDYQRQLATDGTKVSPHAEHGKRTAEGTLERFAREDRPKGTVYYLRLAKDDRIYTGGTELSTKLPLTREGDKVRLQYIESDEDVVPIIGFDNLDLTLRVKGAVAPH